MDVLDDAVVEVDERQNAAVNVKQQAKKSDDILDEVAVTEGMAIIQLQSFSRGCQVRKRLQIPKNTSPSSPSPPDDFPNEVKDIGSTVDAKEITNDDVENSAIAIKELYIENQNLRGALKIISDRLDSVLEVNRKKISPQKPQSNQKDEAQKIFREMLHEESDRLRTVEKRKQKELKKAMEQLDKLKKKNKRFEGEISSLKLDPQTQEDRDHELDVKISALESTSQSLLNVTKNQKSEYLAMRKAGEEFEDHIKAFQEELNDDKKEARAIEKEQRSDRKKRPTKVNKKLQGLKEENQFLNAELSRHKKKGGHDTGERIMTRIELAMLKHDVLRKNELDAVRKKIVHLDTASSTREKRLKLLIEEVGMNLRSYTESIEQSKKQTKDKCEEISKLRAGAGLLRQHHRLANRRYESASAPCSSSGIQE